jgi:DNA polymerase I
MNKIYVIDASNYLFRAYFAIRGMSNKEGLATNALFGFIRSIQKILTDFSPSYMAIVFDGPDNKSSRTKIYKDYKGHREKMPDDLYLQIALAKKYCTLKGLAIVEKSGVEADDSMGSIARWAESHDFETYLCSSDKDLCQLVSNKTFILNTFKENLVMKKGEVIEKFGVKPEQIIDYLAIVGDSSDNIPGIASFGPKKAQMLLSAYPSLNKIYENIDTIENAKLKQKLLEEKQSANISYQLATIDCQVDIEKEAEYYKIKEMPDEPLTNFFQEMNFNFFLRQMPGQESPQKKKPQLFITAASSSY